MGRVPDDDNKMEKLKAKSEFVVCDKSVRFVAISEHRSTMKSGSLECVCGSVWAMHGEREVGKEKVLAAHFQLDLVT